MKTFQKTMVLSTMLAMTLTSCSGVESLPTVLGAQQPGAMLQAANAGGTAQGRTAKAESPLVNKGNIKVEMTAFDKLAESRRNPKTVTNPAFAQATAAGQSAARSPFDPGNPFNNNLPFRTYSEFVDYVRYGYGTTYEDYKYLGESNGRYHFNKNQQAFQYAKELYKATNEDLKRFMMVDTLANSLQVGGRELPYQETHNPPAQANYKMFPTDAAKIMPTFGEIESYNRSSYEVPYTRWDTYRAARYYQANYARLMQLVMEYGPSKRDCWKTVHREISTYADQYN